ncbi:hypothetical protein [Nocardiopsis sp. L17-MgMaSL7]|uniref:hypothetical protein n=1 Tax=Nocardiopsis sp. L17-MgMaSL7 TaxID=1938893 RepID=UPI000D8B3842|nr:hypothetical protein [Nocardiopsis sp. L17-MgMaSL7]PWV50211.1 hypothetical protein BDW27_108249 [Nocardiopsis sp. L17-MgMaSL7]
MDQGDVNGRTAHGLTRRSLAARSLVLTGVAVTGAVAGTVGVSGCAGADWYPFDVTPDVAVLRSLIREKERAIVRHEAALEHGTGPAELLERLLEDHLTHLDALLDALPEGVTAHDTDGDEAEPPAPVGEAALDAVPDTAGLRALAAAATSARLDQAAAVTDPGLAQLVSGIGACEAGHAHLLARA